MEKTIGVLNEMVRGGVLSAYAIGGAVAAIFFSEPVTTYDLDAFVFLPEVGSAGPIVSLDLPYRWLGARGYRMEREHVVVEGVPVQLIPVYNSLVEEAVRAAVDLPYGKETARVCRVEYLVAILVQTARPKDRARFAVLREQAQVDEGRLAEILTRHGLVDRAREWTRDVAI